MAQQIEPAEKSEVVQQTEPTKQAELEFFASCLGGLEQVLADELRSFGVERVRPLGGGVAFFCEPVLAYRACLWSRLASRIMLVVGRVNARDAELLYAGAYEIAWEQVLAPGATMAVRAHGTNENLRNTRFTALKVKDAIVDRLRTVRDERPSVDARSPRAAVDVRVREGRATISLDFSGEALSHRGYFTDDDGEDAALSCMKAAGMLALAGWVSRPAQGCLLVDPACRDGIVLVEAASIACDLANGLARQNWGFRGWARHDEAAWSTLTAEAEQRFVDGLQAVAGLSAEQAQSSAPPDSSHVRFLGMSDSSPQISRARAHVRRAGLRQVVSVERTDAATVEAFWKAAANGVSAALVSGGNSLSGQCGIESAQGIPTAGVSTNQLHSQAFQADHRADEFAGRRLQAPQGILTTDAPVNQFYPHASQGDQRADAAANQLHTQALPGSSWDSSPMLLVACDLDAVARGDSAAGVLSDEATFVRSCASAPVGARFAASGGSELAARFGCEPVVRHTLGKGRVEVVVEVFDTPPRGGARIQVIGLQDGQPHNIDVFEQASDQFAARLRKVFKERRKWAAREGVTCYRIYDADLRDYALAIDWYAGAGEAQGNDYLHIAEYAPPASVDAGKARRRFSDALAIAPIVCGVRPDHVFAKRRVREKGGSQYRNAGTRAYRTTVREGGYLFEVDLAGRLDTGIFLDHRITRALVRDAADGARFLNLFAYTGTASVYAAGGGAVTTKTVDLSANYLDWARRNMVANGFTGKAHSFERVDVLKWITQARRSRERYDLVFVDPPTFSNSKAMGKKTWDVQRDHVELLIGVAHLLAEGGQAIFSCNLRSFKPDLEKLARYGIELEDISLDTIPEDFARTPKIHKCYRICRQQQAVC